MRIFPQLLRVTLLTKRKGVTLYCDIAEKEKRRQCEIDSKMSRRYRPVAERERERERERTNTTSSIKKFSQNSHKNDYSYRLMIKISLITEEILKQCKAIISNKKR